MRIWGSKKLVLHTIDNSHSQIGSRWCNLDCAEDCPFLFKIFFVLVSDHNVTQSFCFYFQVNRAWSLQRKCLGTKLSVNYLKNQEHSIMTGFLQVLIFQSFFIEKKKTFRHKASSDLKRGQSEWGDRNTERKVWNLAKFQVVQRKEKIGRNRRKTKLTGLEEAKGKGKKEKKTGQKRRRRVQRRPEKGSISSFPSRSAILDTSSLRCKGQGGWNRFSVGERGFLQPDMTASMLIDEDVDGLNDRQLVAHRTAVFFMYTLITFLCWTIHQGRRSFTVFSPRQALERLSASLCHRELWAAQLNLWKKTANYWWFASTTFQRAGNWLSTIWKKTIQTMMMNPDKND